MAVSAITLTTVGPVLERIFGLGAPRTTRVEYRGDQRVETADGTVLATDLYLPKPAGTDEAIPPGPTVIVRTPYDKEALMSVAYGVLLARRGLRVVVQDVRGAFGSTGDFTPFHHERADGLTTLDWVRGQSWCDGRVATAGASYVGHTQWAVAPYADPPLAAMAAAITTANFGPSFYPGGSMSWWTVLAWSSLIGTQEDDLTVWAKIGQQRQVKDAVSTLPVTGGDRAAIGRHVSFLHEVVDHSEPGDPFWEKIANDHDVENLPTPVSMITGWQDVFADRQLHDFTRLQEGGVEARLTVGPWFHGQPSSLGPIYRDQISWIEGQLLRDRAALQRPPVRLFLQGANRWLDFDRWPVPSTPTRWSLRVDGSVGPTGEQPDAAEVGARSFLYDPADPTPTVGGPILGATAGVKNNRAVEARSDVLVYTSDRLRADVDVIGEIQAEVYVRTEHPDADVFVRVCDVDEAGRSRNVTERLLRLRADDPPAVDDLGTRRVFFALWPTAHRFRVGHRLRVQVSGGAMPTYVRNHQTGEPIATAVRTQAGRTEVLHGAAFPTSLTLPVFGAA